jgi:hypothetical protein
LPKRFFFSFRFVSFRFWVISFRFRFRGISFRFVSWTWNLFSVSFRFRKLCVSCVSFRFVSFLNPDYFWFENGHLSSEILRTHSKFFFWNHKRKVAFMSKFRLGCFIDHINVYREQWRHIFKLEFYLITEILFLHFYSQIWIATISIIHSLIC